jgi:MoxR-like ATPase
VKGLAKALGLQAKRLQFTPDLLPGDITGNPMLQETADGRRFVFQPGPIFANLVLADEINRASPKTQSALLEAMQERRVTVMGDSHPLPAPFFVLATQNPIELEGTYPLPEAQLDRFIFNIMLDYLPAEEELKVLDLTTTSHKAKVNAVTNPEEICDFQALVRMVPIAESVARHAVMLVRASRPSNPDAPDFVKKYVNFGASVRAAQSLVLAAKARALMNKRVHVTYDDIEALVRPILRHRILLNFPAESEKLTADDILGRLIEATPRPKA